MTYTVTYRGEQHHISPGHMLQCFTSAMVCSQVSPSKSQQCGQLPTYDRMFSYSPAMFFAAMAYQAIQLKMMCPISRDRLWNPHHNAENRMINS